MWPRASHKPQALQAARAPRPLYLLVKFLPFITASRAQFLMSDALWLFFDVGSGGSIFGSGGVGASGGQIETVKGNPWNTLNMCRDIRET